MDKKLEISEAVHNTKVNLGDLTQAHVLQVDNGSIDLIPYIESKLGGKYILSNQEGEENG